MPGDLLALLIFIGLVIVIAEMPLNFMNFDEKERDNGEE